MEKNNKNNNYYLKTNRSFSFISRFGWIFTILIGVVGQFIPFLGLAVPFIMIALILTSLFKGKYWCGNFCPHGSFFDNITLQISRNKKIPSLFGSRYFIAVVLIFFIFNLSSRFFRIYNLMGTTEFYEKLGFIFSNIYLMVLLTGSFLAIIINPRTWCKFCPMGTMQWFFYKIGKKFGLTRKTDEMIIIEKPEKCIKCGKCARVCPVQLTPYLEFNNNKFEEEQCIRCNTCVKNCPLDILHLAHQEKYENIIQNSSN